MDEPHKNALALALDHHQAGHRAAAEALYRRVIGQNPGNPTALYLLGWLRFEAGFAEEAIALLRAVVALRPATAAGHIALGRMLVAQNEVLAAIAPYRAALAFSPDEPGLAGELAQALCAGLGLIRGVLAGGRPQEAADALEKIGDPALLLPPLAAEAWFLRGRVAKALHEFLAAITAYERAIALEPGYAAAHLDLGNCLAEMERPNDAERALGRALAIDPGLKEAHASLGSVLLFAGREDAAERCYRAALAIDPAMVVAHQNLAAICQANGRTVEAREHRDAAYRRQNLFIEAAGRAGLAVLMPTTAESGNVPTKFLFPRHRCTILKWFIEYAGPDDAARLPPYDIVFNGIGDPDAALPAAAPLARFLAQCRKPVLNAPAAVERTRRDRLAGLLEGIPNIVVPAVLRLEPRVRPGEGIGERLARAGPSFPILLRRAGSHGGAGVRLVSSAAELAGIPIDGAETWYAAEFRPYRSADGWHRKYRIIFIDCHTYPYHLALSRHWLVHYVTADMLSDPAKSEEDKAFLEDPEVTIGALAMTAIAAIGRRLDLDFAGIDFSILPDGRVLVFEANATMLVHPEAETGPFAYRNPAVQRILDAFGALVHSRTRSGATRVSRWGGPSPGIAPESNTRDHARRERQPA